jgi:hypothetical protein
MVKWLSHPDALRPHPCKCGHPQSVVIHCDTESMGWMLCCWKCEEYRSNPDRHMANCMVGEVREMGVRKPEPDGRRQRSDPKIIVWVRDGQSVHASVVISMADGIRQLSDARKLDEEKPGPWGLHMRDGVPWAPWCPTGMWRAERFGQPLPYRTTILKSTSKPRTCLVCDAPMEAGETAWRPYNPGPGTVANAGWDSMATRDAIVCARCVAKLRVGPAANDGHRRRSGQ